MGPVAGYSLLRRNPEPRYRPLVDGWLPLDSGLRRNDVPGIVLCQDIFEHRLIVVSSKCHPELSEGSKVPGNMVLTPSAMA